MADPDRRAGRNAAPDDRAEPPPALVPGAYLLLLERDGAELAPLDGTLRVERGDGMLAVSGDLYRRPPLAGPGGVRPAPAPTADDRPPVFARGDYHAYLRATRCGESPARCELALEVHGFDAAGSAWRRLDEWTVALERSPDIPDLDPLPPFLEGPVRDGEGRRLGRLQLLWVSPFLRAATLEIDAVAGCELPLDNGAGLDWAGVGAAVGWRLEAVAGDADVAEPEGGRWTDAQCHRAMELRREQVDLDRRWHVHALIVRDLVRREFAVMYDTVQGDLDDVPREGLVVPCQRLLPDEPRYGRVRGQRIGASPAVFFRIAVHEFGHALGLSHNVADTCFMNPTETVAAAATEAVPFPDNTRWRFADSDERRLRHWPDPMVRPGGLDLGHGSAGPRPAQLPQGLELDVEAPDARVALGVPIGLRLRLRNAGGRPVVVPARIDFGHEGLRGRVVDPSGRVRRFAAPPATDAGPGEVLLGPGSRVDGAIELLRGDDGPLLRAPGVHRIEIDIGWQAPGTDCFVSAFMHVLAVQPADLAATAATLALFDRA